MFTVVVENETIKFNKDNIWIIEDNQRQMQTYITPHKNKRHLNELGVNAWWFLPSLFLDLWESKHPIFLIIPQTLIRLIPIKHVGRGCVRQYVIWIGIKLYDAMSLWCIWPPRYLSAFKLSKNFVFIWYSLNLKRTFRTGSTVPVQIYRRRSFHCRHKRQTSIWGLTRLSIEFELNILKQSDNLLLWVNSIKNFFQDNKYAP